MKQVIFLIILELIKIILIVIKVIMTQVILLIKYFENITTKK